MADISKISLPNGSEYNIKDTVARESIPTDEHINDLILGKNYATDKIIVVNEPVTSETKIEIKTVTNPKLVYEKSEVDALIPTEISELNNDVGFITSAYHDSTKLDTSLKGSNSGLAELDENGKVPSSQLPSYVDDVLEYSNKASFPTNGETGKIYIDASTNITYRWSGSVYTPIGSDLALGETSSTAYRGDRGKIAYDHSQSAHAPVDAQKNVQSDWNATSGDAKILNKPYIPLNLSDLSNDSGFITADDIPPSDAYTISGWMSGIPSGNWSFTVYKNGVECTEELYADIHYSNSKTGTPTTLSSNSGYFTGTKTAKYNTAYKYLIDIYTESTKSTLLCSTFLNYGLTGNKGDAYNLTEADKTEIAGLVNVPTKTSDLTNDSGYITSSDLPENLSYFYNDMMYVTSDEVPSKMSDLDNDMGLVSYDEVPRYLSALENDMGFVTSYDIPSSLSSLENDVGYITTSDIPYIPTNTSDLYNDSDFITLGDLPTNVSDFVNDANYATYEDIPTNVSAFENDSGYITRADYSNGNAAGTIKVDSSYGTTVEDEGTLVAEILTNEEYESFNEKGFISKGTFDAVLSSNLDEIKADLGSKVYYSSDEPTDAEDGDLWVDESEVSAIDYTKIVNKPQINGITLDGDKSLADLDIIIPIKNSELENDSEYITVDDVPPALFWCTYGTTTYDEITQAINDNKMPICSRSGRLYKYSTSSSSNGHYFAVLSSTTVYRLTCNLESVWSNTSYELAELDNIPTNVSTLNNDAGYLDSSSSIGFSQLTGLATEDWTFTPTSGSAFTRKVVIYNG